MNDLKLIIAKNISGLRRSAGMTQITLAEKLNYSDKAISKWERGESLPDIGVFKQIADLFGVTVDYLLCEHSEESFKPEPVELPADIAAAQRKNRITITLQATAAVWLIATIIYVVLDFATGLDRLWSVYVYAIPFSAIVALVFNSIWGTHKKLNYAIISVLVWSLLLCIYVIFLEKNIALIFCIGIPAQIIILLWSRIKRTSVLLEEYLPDQLNALKDKAVLAQAQAKSSKAAAAAVKKDIADRKKRERGAGGSSSADGK